MTVATVSATYVPGGGRQLAVAKEEELGNRDSLERVIRMWKGRVAVGGEAVAI